MFCQNCGREIPEKSFCDCSGQPLEIKSHLVPAIIVAFCCTPLGVAAIVYAARVSGLVTAGRIEEAVKSAKIAKILCWIGFALWIMNIIVSFGILIAMFVLENSGNSAV